MPDPGDPEQARVTASIDKPLKEQMMRNLDHGELSERIRRMAQEIAFGEEVGRESAIRAELQNLRDEQDADRSQKREITARMEERQTRIERLEERMANEKAKEREYETLIGALESTLYDGTRVWAGDTPSALVSKAAAAGETSPEAVVSRLQERNPGIPDYAFRRGTEDEEHWTGTTVEDAVDGFNGGDN